MANGPRGTTPPFPHSLRGGGLGTTENSLIFGVLLGVRLCVRDILKAFAGFAPPLMVCVGVADGATLAEEGLRMRPAVDIEDRREDMVMSKGK